MRASSDRVKLSIVPPAGVETAQVDETNNTVVRVFNNGQVICTARYVFRSGPTKRGLFRVKLQPTARLYPTESPALADKIAPSGVWTVRLHNVSLGPDQPVHAWIQRDDTPYGYPLRGRQSYFDEPCYVRFDAQGRVIDDDNHPEQLQQPCHAKRAGLINALGTGRKTIVVGGILRKEMIPAR